MASQDSCRRNGGDLLSRHLHRFRTNRVDYAVAVGCSSGSEAVVPNVQELGIDNPFPYADQCLPSNQFRTRAPTNRGVRHQSLALEGGDDRIRYPDRGPEVAGIHGKQRVARWTCESVHLEIGTASLVQAQAVRRR